MFNFLFSFLFHYLVPAVGVIRTEKPRQKLLHTLCQQSSCHPSGAPPWSFQKGNGSHLLNYRHVTHFNLACCSVDSVVSKILVSLLKWKCKYVKIVCVSVDMLFFCKLFEQQHVMLYLGISVIPLNKPVIVFSIRGSSKMTVCDKPYWIYIYLFHLLVS